MRTPARLLPRRKAEHSARKIPGGKSGQPLDTVGKKPAPAGGKAMNHGKKEKTGDGEKLFAIDPGAARKRRLWPRRIGPAFFFQTPNICGLTAGFPPLTMYMKKAVSLCFSALPPRQPPSGVRLRVARARILARPPPYSKKPASASNPAPARNTIIKYPRAAVPTVWLNLI